MSNDLRDFVLRVSERVGHGERAQMSGHACDFVCFGECACAVLSILCISYLSSAV